MAGRFDPTFNNLSIFVLFYEKENSTFRLLFSIFLPNFNAAARPLTTAIGCFKQNSCNCGLNACFLFSK